jgi:hypothetical protein
MTFLPEGSGRESSGQVSFLIFLRLKPRKKLQMYLIANFFFRLEVTLRLLQAFYY